VDTTTPVQTTIRRALEHYRADVEGWSVLGDVEEPPRLMSARAYRQDTLDAIDRALESVAGQEG
jgi:hypothetical protein